MIEIKKIEPIDLPGSLVLQLEKLYHSTLRDFTVMIDKTNWTMYVEKSVPDTDVQQFIDYIYYPGRCVNEAKADFADYVFNTYGQSAYLEIFKAYSQKRRIPVITLISPFHIL